MSCNGNPTVAYDPDPPQGARPEEGETGAPFRSRFSFDPGLSIPPPCPVSTCNARVTWRLTRYGFKRHCAVCGWRGKTTWFRGVAP